MSAAATAGAGAAAKNDEVVRHFVIPVPGSDESIVVASNELPADSAEVVEVLRSVSAPVSCWLDLLGAYWRQAAALPPSVSDKEDGPRAQYEKLLRAALSMGEWSLPVLVPRIAPLSALLYPIAAAVADPAVRSNAS